MEFLTGTGHGSDGAATVGKLIGLAAGHERLLGEYTFIQTPSGHA
jgi:hypothetical protein